ncbi:cell filamentation protein [Arthrobacter sp. GAS37]|uniref:Fic/DOC family protein n=1 Tax=Arthrobacter sp. GAS37 TaxID=3156261 RepID=UPI003838FA94
MTAWLDYFWPETITPEGYGVLRNHLGIRDFDALQIAEYELAGERSRQLLQGEVRIPLEPDVSYLQNVHRHLFQDVYPWAGELRNTNMGKEGSEFADRDLLRVYLRPLMRTVVSTEWKQLDHEDFSRMSAVTFAGINHGHPFREGNGRTTKAVLHEISKLSNFELDFNQVSPDQWNAMAAASMPGPGEIMPRSEEAMAVFRTVAVRRVTPVPDQRKQAARETSKRIFSSKQQGQEASRTLRAGKTPEKSQGQGYGKGF